MLRRLTDWDKRVDFLAYLLAHSATIEAVVSYHLGLSGRGSCYLAPVDDWIHGSYNMCLPVYVKSWGKHPETRVMIRFSLPYKLGGEEFPGNAEEKLRCEAAAYTWIQANCPGVPIPQLLGFAFRDDQCVSSNNSGTRALIAYQSYIVCVIGKHALVRPSSGRPWPAFTLLPRLSSSTPIYPPPLAAHPQARISPHRVYRRR